MRKTAAYLNSQGVRVGLAVSDPGTHFTHFVHTNFCVQRTHQRVRVCVVVVVLQEMCATFVGRLERRSRTR
jgi:hypothetical protein